jgi:hypothetical protein
MSPFVVATILRTLLSSLAPPVAAPETPVAVVPEETSEAPTVPPTASDPAESDPPESGPPEEGRRIVVEITDDPLDLNQAQALD